MIFIDGLNQISEVSRKWESCYLHSLVRLQYGSKYDFTLKKQEQEAWKSLLPLS